MNKKYQHTKNSIVSFTVIAFLFAFITSCNPTKRLNENEVWLYKQNIHIDNSEISKKKIKKYFRQKTNKLMFGIAVPVFFYNSIDPEKEKRRDLKRIRKDTIRNKKRRENGKRENTRFYLSRWLLKIGEPLVLFDEFENYKTEENILDYLKSKGYYYAEVESIYKFNEAADDNSYSKRVDFFDPEDKKMWLSYKITTKEPYTIDSFYFDIENQHIKNIIEQDSLNLKLKKGVIFDSDLLKAERLRITKLLKSNSYFLFKKEYIRYFADTNKLEKKVKIKFSILKPNISDKRIESNHKRFKINDIHIYLGYDPREDLLLEKDYLKTFESLKFDNIIIHYKGKSVLDPNVILRGLYIKGDSLYNFSDVEETYKYLTNLHTFKLINIGFKNTTAGGFIKDTEKTFGKLDCIIKLTTTIQQSYSIEAEANVSSYGDYGAATNIGYKNQNLWRKAITLDLNTKAAREIIYVQKNGERELFKVSIMGAKANFVFPKFLTPLKFDKFDFKYKPKTNLQVSADYQERYDYTNLISSFSYGYRWKTNKNTSHFISLSEFSTTKVFDIRKEYIDFVFKNDTWSSFFDNILLGMNYQYIYSSHNSTIYDNSHFFRYGFELSGNLLAAASSLLKLDDVKIPYSDLYANSFFRLPYFQFAKIDIEYRKYLLLINGQQLVFRSFFGVGLPYGNLKFMPMQKQYYSGGANSIRAWAPKRLGPGSLDAEEVLSDESSSTYNNLFQNSDMKLEFNIEHRFKIFWKLDGAFFLDMGNIWSLSDSKFKEEANFKWNKFYKDIAIGTGAGIRLDFNFFVVRFDLGVRLFDPVLKGSNWAWKTGNDTSENFNFNFGIGYPF